VNVYLSLNNSPRVKVGLRLSSKQKQTDCLIDTGFSSGLALSQSLLKHTHFPLVAQQEFELADSSRVMFDVYLATVEFGGKKRKLRTVFTESKDNIVGMEFLNGLEFNLNLRNRTIKLK